MNVAHVFVQNMVFLGMADTAYLKPCAACPQFFLSKQGKSYCSKRCAHREAERYRRARVNPRPMKLCVACGTEFKPKTRVSIYCSRNCGYRTQYRQNRPQRQVKNRRQADERHQKVAALLGGVCVKCGISDWRVLQVNHINGGGQKEQRRGRSEGRPHMYQDILTGRRSTDDLDLRCANCNVLYEYERRMPLQAAVVVFSPEKPSV